MNFFKTLLLVLTVVSVSHAASVDSTLVVYEKFSIKGKDLSVTFPRGQFRVGYQPDVKWPTEVFSKHVTDRLYFVDGKNQTQQIELKLERGRGDILRKTKDFNLTKKYNRSLTAYGPELTESRSCIYERQVIGEHCEYKDVDECPSIRGIDGVCVGWPDAKIENKLVCEDEVEIISGTRSVNYRMADAVQSEDYIFTSPKTSQTLAIIQGDVRTY